MFSLHYLRQICDCETFVVNVLFRNEFTHEVLVIHWELIPLRLFQNELQIEHLNAQFIILQILRNKAFFLCGFWLQSALFLHLLREFT
jgi:hypothetical protein